MAPYILRTIILLLFGVLLASKATACSGVSNCHRNTPEVAQIQAASPGRVEIRIFPETGGTATALLLPTWRFLAQTMDLYNATILDQYALAKPYNLDDIPQHVESCSFRRQVITLYGDGASYAAFQSCTLTVGANYTLLVYVTDDADGVEDEFTGEVTGTTFIAGDFCPPGYAGSACQWPAIKLDPGVPFVANYTLQAYQRVYFTFTQTNLQNANAEPLNFKLRVTQRNLTNQLPQTSVTASHWCDRTCATPWNSHFGAVNEGFARVINGYGPDLRPTVYNGQCSPGNCNNRVWHLSLFLNAANWEALTIEARVENFCSGNGTYNTMSDWQPGPCACSGRDNVADYAFASAYCSVNNVPQGCCAACPEGYRGPQCQYQKVTPPRVDHPSTTLQNGYFEDFIAGSTASPSQPRLYKLELPAAVRSPLIAFISMTMHEMDYNKQINAINTVKLQAGRVYTSSCPYNRQWIDGNTANSLFEVSPWTGNWLKLAVLPRRSDTSSGYPASPCAADELTASRLWDVSHVSVLVPALSINATLRVDYVEMCGGHGTYQPVSMSCVCQAGWTGTACTPWQVWNFRNDYQIQQPCCAQSTVPLVAEMGQMHAASPNGTVYEAELVIPEWQTQGYTRLTISQDDKMVNGQSSTATGLNVKWIFTADPAECPATLAGAFSPRIMCGSTTQPACNPGNSYFSNDDRRSAPLSYEYEFDIPVTFRREYTCNCQYTFGVGDVYTMKLTLDQSFGCKVKATAIVTPQCRNGGTFNTWATSAEDRCTCPKGWDGDVCDIRVPILEEVEISLAQAGLLGGAAQVHNLVPGSAARIRISQPLGLPYNAFTYTMTAESEGTGPLADCSNLRIVSKYTCTTWSGVSKNAIATTDVCAGQGPTLDDVGSTMSFWSHGNTGSCYAISGQPGKYNCKPWFQTEMQSWGREDNCGCQETPISWDAIWSATQFMVFNYFENMTDTTTAATYQNFCKVTIRATPNPAVPMSNATNVLSGSCPAWMPLDCARVRSDNPTANSVSHGRCVTSYDPMHWDLPEPSAIAPLRNSRPAIFGILQSRQVLKARCECASGWSGLDCSTSIATPVADNQELFNEGQRFLDLSNGQVARSMLRVSKTNNQVTVKLAVQTPQPSAGMATGSIPLTFPDGTKPLSWVFVRAAIGRDPPMPKIVYQAYETLHGYQNSKENNVTFQRWGWTGEDVTGACEDYFYAEYQVLSVTENAETMTFTMSFKNGGSEKLDISTSEGPLKYVPAQTNCPADSFGARPLKSAPFKGNEQVHVLVWTQGANKLPIKDGCVGGAREYGLTPWTPANAPADYNRGCLPPNSGTWGPGWGTDQMVYSIELTAKISDTVADIMDYIALSLVGLAGLSILVYLIYMAKQPGGFKAALEASLTRKVEGEKRVRKKEIQLLSIQSTPASRAAQQYANGSVSPPGTADKATAWGTTNTNDAALGFTMDTAALRSTSTSKNKGVAGALREDEKKQKGQGDGEDGEYKEGCCSLWTSRILVVILGLVIGLVVAFFTTMFNISILHSSMSNLTSNLLKIDIMPSIQKIQQTMRDALSVLKCPPWLKDFFAGIRDYFKWLDIVTGLGLGWNCGGALSMFTPVLLLLGALLLVYLLQKDVLLVLGIKGRGVLTGRSFLYKQFRMRLAQGATMVALLTLQSVIIILPQTVGSLWGIERSCSDLDYKVVTVGRSVSIVCIVAFVYIVPLMFAGVKAVSLQHLTVGWVRGIISLLMLAFGIWTPTTVGKFDVLQRAQTFDNDPDDDDNLQQDVMELIAKSRSLMWMPLPGGVVLTQLASCVNMPPLLIKDYKKTGLTLKSGFYKRLTLWLISMARFGLYILAVFMPAEYAFLGALLAQVLYVIIDTLWPRSKLMQSTN